MQARIGLAESGLDRDTHSKEQTMQWVADAIMAYTDSRMD